MDNKSEELDKGFEEAWAEQKGPIKALFNLMFISGAKHNLEMVREELIQEMNNVIDP